MSWLDTNADGLALMLAIGVLGLAALLAALAIEAWLASGMRRRHRARAALRRYLDSIGPDSWPAQ